MLNQFTSYSKSGRIFCDTDILLIKKIVKEEYHSGRCSISRSICKNLNWYSENGKPKEWVCRELLIQLEKDKIITLPLPHPKSFNRFKKKSFESIKFIPPNKAFIGKLGEFSRPFFMRAKVPKENDFWEYLVSKYHYLGYNGVIGRFLKYFVYIGEVPVACLGYSSAALKVAVRDNWLGWDRNKQVNGLKHIANQFRFIIFPWVQIKYLASFIISKSIPILIQDWKKEYNVDIYLLETFVQKGKFKATSYKAANWIFLGETKGYSKKKDSYIKHGIIKNVYIYPINLKKIIS